MTVKVKGIEIEIEGDCEVEVTEHGVRITAKQFSTPVPYPWQPCIQPGPWPWSPTITWSGNGHTTSPLLT